MRIPRIFQNQALHIHHTLVLDEDARRHLGTVLRLQNDARITLFNGDGYEYPSIIKHTTAKILTATIEDKIYKNLESPLYTHLGQVITKANHMDYTLQKSVELGISHITPLYATRGEVHLKGDREQKKQDHWQKIITHACQQCGRNIRPTLEKPMSLLEWIKKTEEKTKLMLDPRATISLNHTLLDSTVALLVGPEGGLSETEESYAKQHGFIGVQLGPRILRTETASLVVLSALQFLAGDLNQQESSP